MSYNCELKTQASQPTLSVRTHASAQELPSLFGRVYAEIMQYLQELGEQPAGMPFAAYHDMNMQNLDIEVGFPVAHKLNGKGEIQASEFPGGKLACVMHVGPYDQLGAAYAALAQWVSEHGFESTGVAYELYYSPPETPPQEIKTEIVFPLKSL